MNSFAIIVLLCMKCPNYQEITLLSRDKMPRQRLVSSEESICSKHSGEILKYYCKVHNDFYCTVCVTLQHKNCTIEYIDDIAAGFETSQEYRSLTKKVLSLLQELKDIKQISTRNSQDLQTVYTQFVSDVKIFRSEINYLLDSMETTILKEAQNVKECDMNAAQTVCATCDTLTTNVHEIVNKLEKQKKYKQQRQLVISSKRAETRICEYEQKIGDIGCQNSIRNYKFHKNEKMLHLLQSLHSLGTLADRGNDSGKIDMERKENEKKEKERIKPFYKDPKSVRTSCAGYIFVKHSEDNMDCWITGGVMIDPNRIALIDNNNFSVKLVNVESANILSYLKLSTKPWDVTCIDKNHIVIACNSRLVFVYVGQTLVVYKEIRVDGFCRGITFNGDQLYVSFVSPIPAVKLINLDGEIIKTLSTDQNGQSLFECPIYICLCRDKSKLFVTDFLMESVISMNLHGRIENVYRDDNLKFLSGLAVDRYDNIYTAGSNSDNIHQISTQCRPIQIILDQTDGIDCPQSVTYCETENRLYISHECVSRQQNLLCVYQMHMQRMDVHC